MDENKQIKENNQIEQMAKDMFFNTFCPHDLCENCYFKEKCKQRTFAKNLVKQGYRKQSDTVRDFIEKLKNKTNTAYYGASRGYQSKNQETAQKAWERMQAYTTVEKFIDELAKEYGVEES